MLTVKEKLIEINEGMHEETRKGVNSILGDANDWYVKKFNNGRYKDDIPAQPNSGKSKSKDIPQVPLDVSGRELSTGDQSKAFPKLADTEKTFKEQDKKYLKNAKQELEKTTGSVGNQSKAFPKLADTEKTFKEQDKKYAEEHSLSKYLTDNKGKLIGGAAAAAAGLGALALARRYRAKKKAKLAAKKTSKS